MEKLAVCRICLDMNVHVHLIESPQLQEIYERLTTIPFQTGDMRPLVLCYICHGQLRASRRLMLKCLKAEELLTEMLNELLTDEDEIPKLTIIDRSALEELSLSEIQHVIIDSAVLNVGDHVKHEIQDYETDVKIEELNYAEDVAQIGYETDVKIEEFSDVEDEPQISYETDVKIEEFCEQQATPNAKPTMKPVLKQTTSGLKDVYILDTEAIKTKCDNDTTESAAPNDYNNINQSDNIKSVSNNSTTVNNVPIDDRLREYNCDTICDAVKPNICEQFICDKCKKSFSRKSKLISHIRVHAGEKHYVCDVCAKGFADMRDLRSHALMHTVKKPFACNVCLKSFHREGNLIIHTRTHTDDSPFVCYVCDKSFREESVFVKHKSTHTGERPYVCNVCNKRYKRKDNLKIHSFTHTREKPYYCNVCYKNFTTPSNLTAHTLIHVGAKPFVCNVCSKTFRRKDYLIVHQRRHTGEKPYDCNVCNKKFRYQGQFIKHKRTHIGEMSRHVCDACGECFNTKNSLTEHIIRLH